MFGCSRQTVHNWMDAGKLKFVLVGNDRRVTSDDLNAFRAARAAARPPPCEDWCSLGELLAAANISRAVLYRTVKRGALDSKTFGGLKYVQTEDFLELIRQRCRRPAELSRHRTLEPIGRPGRSR